MAANTSMIYPGTPKTFAAQATLANPNRDGTGDVVTVASGGDNGARIDRVHVRSHGSTLGGAVRLFVVTGGSTFLLDEVPVQGGNVLGPNPGFNRQLVRTDGEPYALLGPGDTLIASTHSANTFDVIAFGGLY